MKILMVLPTDFPPDSRVEKEASALIEAGHEVTLLCLNLNKRLPEEEYNRIHVRRIKPRLKGISKILMNVAVRLNPILKIKRHIPKVHNLIIDFLGSLSPYLFKNIDYAFKSDWYKEIEKIAKKSDVIHVHDLPLVRTAIAIGRRYKIPVIFDLHENWPEAMIAHTKYKGLKKYLLKFVVDVYKRQECYSLKYADKIIVVVDESKKRLINKGITKNKIFVIMNSVDIPFFNKNKNHKKVARIVKKIKGKEGFIVTYTGTFGKHRGLELAIKAMPNIIKKNSNVHLLLVGDGPNKNELEKLVKELRIQKNVHFMGFVPSKYLPTFINYSDVCFVLHADTLHTRTTIPHKLFEYMALGKPVIVTNVAPLKRIVNKEKCGFVVNYDKQEIAQAIIDFTDKKLAIQLGNNGRSSAKKYSWKKISKVLIDIYKNWEKIY